MAYGSPAILAIFGKRDRGYNLPLLAPAQVGQLSEMDQAAHQAWVEAHLRQLDEGQ